MGHEIDRFNNNFIYMYLVSIIMINFKEDINRSFLELRLPGFEISRIGIGISGTGVRIETYC